MRNDPSLPLLLSLLLAAPALAAAAVVPPQLADEAFCEGIEFLVANAGDFGLTDPVRELRRSSVVRDAGGALHARFEQLHHGVPVFGRQLIVHFDADGAPRSVGGNFAAEVAAATRPAITSDEAARRAREAFPGLEGWKGELLLFPRDGELVLVYRVVLEAVEPPARVIAFIGALDGGLVFSYDDLQTAHDAFFGHPPLGHSLYLGDVRPATQALLRGCESGALPAPAACPFALRDGSRGLLRTLDMQNLWSGGGVIFSDDDNVWGDGTNADRASAGVDVHFGAEMAYDYFLARHRREGIYDDRRGTVSRVHRGVAWNNARWNSFCKCLEFGDGDGTRFGPLVSIDMVAHEMTHGVTEATAGLVYYDETGGLNESMSDIFGTMVEYFAAGRGVATTPDYWIGEDFFTPGTPGDAARYMDDPTRDATNPYPDKDSIDSYDDYTTCRTGWAACTDTRDVCDERFRSCIDPHFVSGIANNVFYLLAEGGRHRNGGAVVGIGRDAAAKVFYDALVGHMVSSETFDDALGHTLLSATEHFGAESPEAASVCQAWKAAAVDGVACSTCPNSGIVAPHSFEEWFHAVNDYAGARGYHGGFRNFHEAIYDGCQVVGTVLLPAASVVQRDVAAADLGLPAGIEERFRAVHDYAAARGFAGGFPNFHEAIAGGELVYGTLLIEAGAGEHRDVPVAELGDPVGAEARFRAVYDYAVAHGFAGGFPNFHQAIVGGVEVYGTILIDRGAAEWRDVQASGLP